MYGTIRGYCLEGAQLVGPKGGISTVELRGATDLRWGAGLAVAAELAPAGAGRLGHVSQGLVALRGQIGGVGGSGVAVGGGAGGGVIVVVVAVGGDGGHDGPDVVLGSAVSEDSRNDRDVRVLALLLPGGEETRELVLEHGLVVDVVQLHGGTEEVGGEAVLSQAGLEDRTPQRNLMVHHCR